MRRRAAAWAVLLLLSAPLGTRAAGNDGTEDVFNFGAGARALGMGRTFVGLADDASAVFWNPAGLYHLDRKSLSLSYTKLFADTLYGYIGYAHPTMDYGTIGVGVMSLVTGSIPAFDEFSYQTGDFSSARLKLLLAYANRLPWLPLTAAATVKVNYSAMNGRSATAINADIGFLYEIIKTDYRQVALGRVSARADEWTAGLTLRNLFVGTGERLYLEEDIERYELVLGTAYRHWFGPDLLARGLLDVLFHQSRAFQLSFGLEVQYLDRFFFRGGWRLDSGFSFGAGVLLADWQLDYALVFRAYGATHNLAVTWSFGESRAALIRAREAEIKNRIDASLREDRDRNSKLFDEKLAVKDRELKTKELEIKSMADRLKDAEKRIDTLRQRQDEEIGDYKRRIEATIRSNEAEIREMQKRRDADLARMRTDMTNQLTRMQSANEARLKELDADFKKRLDAVGRDNTQERERLKIQYEQQRTRLKTDETLKSADYAKGVELYNKQQYEEARKIFQKVQALDGNYAETAKYLRLIAAQRTDATSYDGRVLELYRRGTQLYVERRYQEAIAVWQEILKLDPYNKLALRNIDMAKRRLEQLKQGEGNR